MPSPALSLGPHIDGAVRLKSTFRDAYERRAYLRAFLLAKRILERPEIIARGRAYLDRFVKHDPRQSRSYRAWTDTLCLSPEEIVVRLLADDSQGAFLRETAPVLTVIPPDDVRALARAIGG
jgi:hypothetical protein